MKTYIYPLAHTPATLITLDEVKDQLVIDRSDATQDDLLNHYRDAAVKYAENYTSRDFTQRKWKLELYGFQNGYEFPKSPVTSIDKLEYKDEDGNWQTLASANYELKRVDDLKSILYFEEFDELPTVQSGYGVRVRLEITTGYATADELPTNDKQAMFLAFTSYYEQRNDSVRALPTASKDLLTRFYYTPSE